MSFIANVKESFYQRSLLREVKNRNSGKPPQPVNPLTARCVVVLFVADDPANRKEVENYRQQRKKAGLKTELLGYFTTEVNPAGIDFDHFSKKDVNWAGVPGGSSVEKYLSRSCDVVLTLHGEAHRQLDYLAAVKSADLRVGAYTGDELNNPYDVQYSTKKKDAGPKEQLTQIERIFKVTNATTTAAV